jgi:ferrous iron transport protein B
MPKEMPDKTVQDRPVQIAFAGNPNTGKSSLFNRLTGLRQHVGNYPGVTVEKKTGVMEHGGREYDVVDLPGTYSLTAASPDEAVVCDELFGRGAGHRPPDLVVCVVDSTALNSLFLAAQISDLGLPMVIALNMWDEAKEKGVDIDAKLLGERLGVPCIPTSAKTGLGVDQLRAAIVKNARGGACMKRPEWPDAVLLATEIMRKGLGENDYTDGELRRVLFGASGTLAHRLGITEARRKEVTACARKSLFDAGINPMACEAIVHYKELRKLTDGVTKGGGDSLKPAGHPHSESIDKLLMHRGWGLLIFIGVMYTMFQAVYSWSAPFMGLIDLGIEKLQLVTRGLLAGHIMLQSLFVDGVIGGVGACLSFVPQILILFMFIAVLEDSGYLPRAAFLMDKLFSWCGLSGRSFVPMLSSYACAVPGIMATRTIKDPMGRLATILVAPLMSCSARLPIYVLFIGLFIEPRYGHFYAGLALFGMHVIGLLIAGPIAFILTHFVLRTKPQPFLLELPPYRVPRVSDVALRMFERGKMFVYKAGTVIFAMTIIVWGLLYFPRPDAIGMRVEADFPALYAKQSGMSETEVRNAISLGEDKVLEARQHMEDAAYIEQSYLGRFGRLIQPVFSPAGFDWKMSVAIASSLPAREVVISTMGIIYSLGTDVEDNTDALRQRIAAETWESGPREGTPIYTLPMVLAVMMFFALCQQCAATLAVIVREAGWKWAGVSFGYMTILAWIAAVIVFQFGSII